MVNKRWKICIPAPFLNCNRIYPIQQKKVKELIDHLSQKEYVRKIIIFGSSVTTQCHCGSDIDVFVLTDKNEKLITKYLPFLYDIWTNFTVDKRMLDEIKKNGVVVYERRNTA